MAMSCARQLSKNTYPTNKLFLAYFVNHLLNTNIFSEMLENTSPTNNVVLVVEWCLKNIVTMKKPFVLCFRLKKIFLQREHNLFDIGFEKPLFQQTIMCLPNISKRI
jgi:hypothetical protein